jgi:hypothetical protein
MNSSFTASRVMPWNVNRSVNPERPPNICTLPRSP